jgi:hypothetical protein
MNFLPVNEIAIPDTLKQRGWANWVAEPRLNHPGKFNKAPRSPYDMSLMSVKDVSRLGDFGAARTNIASGKATGLGVVLNGDGLVGIDIDGLSRLERSHPVFEFLDLCKDPRYGVPPYIEQSPSGDGLRVFLCGSLPKGAPSRRGPLEIYCDARFLTVTGQLHPAYSPQESAIGLRQDLIDRFSRLLKAAQSGNCNVDAELLETLSVVPDQAEALIQKAQKTIPELWAGKWRETGKYPSQSEADYAALGRLVELAFEMQIEAERIPPTVARAFSQSGLFRPEKDKSNLKYAIPKLVSERLAEGSDSQVRTDDPLSALRSLALRPEHVRKMSEAKFLVPNMIVKGHVHAFVAPGNGGKTTIFIHLCEQLTSNGYEVWYVNVDGSPGDLKRHFAHAEKHGYQVVSPDAIEGKSIKDVLLILRGLAQSPSDLSNAVFIFDTLKKFVNVIEKGEARNFYKLLRALSVKGATICLLGHTNKYKDKEDNPVFEGTADLRNDVDNLIYLDLFKDHQAQKLEVTTRPDKVRAEFHPRSFEIFLGDDRRVVECSSVITIQQKEEEGLLVRAEEAIKAGFTSQKELVQYLRQFTVHGDKWVKGLLRRAAEIGDRITKSPAGRGRDLLYAIAMKPEDYPF